ncbi:MAG: hypothetical protein NC133_03055 [Prevotella sp.]|nr:hypothetical protein [Prevotella sp.]
MDALNFILIGFIIALAVLSLFWAFNTVRRIEIQKSFCAEALTSIAKLWRRAKFVPEDAKDRESLYLYRDFLQKFDDKACKYPIMVKNGGVRCMTRKEYDSACGQGDQRPFSILILAATVLLAVVALVVNIAVTKNVILGLGLALIMPVVQGVLSFFVIRFNQEKNAYREGIFTALKENSVNFLSITKPFIVVDAYPDKFGKNAQPLYAVKGELSDTQLAETRDFIIRQKEAETKVVLKNVDNSAEIAQINNPQPIPAAPEPPTQTTPTDVQPTAETSTTPANPPADAPAATPNQQPTAEAPTENNAATATEPTAAEPEPQPLTDAEKMTLITNLVDDTVQAEVNREIKKAATAAQTPEPIDDLPPLATAPVDVPTPEVAAPAADDFSLDAIGQALDAEIAKRNKKK